MFNLINRTNMKAGNPSLDCLTEGCARALESFLAYNPSLRASSFIEVTRSGHGYKAQGRYYVTGRGAITAVTVFSNPLAC